MTNLIQIESYPVKTALSYLLKDRTTRKNIVWATDTYTSFGPEYESGKEITDATLFGLSTFVIQPRITKALEEKIERTKKKAEVFTPAWICNKMNNYCDEEWFGRENVFNREQNDNTWKVNTEPVRFPDTKKKSWKDYVDSKRMEITCGEAPYLVSRYDAATGELIEISRRIGMLDRKLRVVNENTTTEEEWMKWTIRAFQSVYGYEYQGDNLLIARINLLQTFVDYLQERWHRSPTEEEAKRIALIISWNLWQMDGLVEIPDDYGQMSMFKELQCHNENIKETLNGPGDCKIFDWRANRSVSFASLRKGA